MNLNRTIWSQCTLPLCIVIFICFFSGSITAAPSSIEGIVKDFRKIEVKEPYTFNYIPVISIYLVGKMHGNNYDYQYMIAKDTTKLMGIPFSYLKKGVYARVHFTRSEPPGMVGKPLEEVRKARYGTCGLAMIVDSVMTPRTITGCVTQLKTFGDTGKVVTIRRNTKDTMTHKYLIEKGKTKIKNGTFSDIKESMWLDISKCDITPPVSPPTGSLNGANLYAGEVAIVKNPTPIQDFLFVNEKSALPYTIINDGHSMVITFGKPATEPVSVLLCNTIGQVIFKADNPIMGNADRIVIPFQNKFSKPMIIQLKSGSARRSEYLYWFH